MSEINGNESHRLCLYRRSNGYEEFGAVRAGADDEQSSKVGRKIASRLMASLISIRRRL